jgi:hypothetical protein
MLVRPDTHLGWRGRRDPAALDRRQAMAPEAGRAGQGDLQLASERPSADIAQADSRPRLRGL